MKSILYFAIMLVICSGVYAFTISESSPSSFLVPDQSYVIKDNVNYKLYYAGDDLASINLAQSPDGLNWTPYVDNPIISDALYHSDVKYYAVGFPGADYGTNNSNMTMNYRMWYQGLDSTSINGWMYAESPDGISWYNHIPFTQSGTPLFTSQTFCKKGKWFPICTTKGMNLGIADVIYTPNASNTGTDWKFRIYANVQWGDWDGSGLYDGKELVVMGFSNDGYDWTGYDPNEVGYATPIFEGTLNSSQFDGNNIGWFKVIKNNDNDWEAFYSGGNDTTYQALNGIGYATSNDGINWTRTQTIFTTDDNIAWRDQSIMMPSVVKTGSNYEIYFLGSNNSDIADSDWIQWQVGRAVLTKPTPKVQVQVQSNKGGGGVSHTTKESGTIIYNNIVEPEKAKLIGNGISNVGLVWAIALIMIGLLPFGIALLWGKPKGSIIRKKK